MKPAGNNARIRCAIGTAVFLVSCLAMLMYLG